jgi:hypothetical protein
MWNTNLLYILRTRVILTHIIVISPLVLSPPPSGEKFEMFVDIRCSIRVWVYFELLNDFWFLSRKFARDIFWPNFVIPKRIKALLFWELYGIILVVYPNPPRQVSCLRKPECPEKTHEFKQSVDWLFSHESVARIEPTISEVKGTCTDTAPTEGLQPHSRFPSII